MAQRVQFGVVLSGDHKGAVRSTRITGKEVRRLRGEVDKTGRATRETDSRFRRWAKSMGTLRGALGPLVGIAGVGMLGRMSQQAIASTAAIQDQADTAGIGAEQFQELTKAMNDMAGVSEDVSAGGLRRFNRRLGLARQGGGAAIKTLERLNISLRQDTPAALEESIRKLAEIESASDRAAAASELFGEDAGPQMATALGKGTEAIEATIERLREQGRIMGEDSVAAANRLNTRFEALADTISTRFKTAVVESAQALEDLFDMPQLGNLEQTTTEQEQRIKSLRQELKRLREERERLESSGIDPSILDPRIEEVRRALRREGVSPGSGADAQANQTLSENLRLLEKIDAKRDEMRASGDLGVAGLVRGGNPLEAGGPGTPRRTDFTGGITGRSTQTPAGGPILLSEGFRRLAEDADKAGESVDDVADKTKQLEGLGDELNFTFSSAFEDAIVEVQKLRGVMQGLAQDILRIIVRKTVTQPIGNALAQSVAGMFGAAESADGNVFTRPSLTTISERGHPEAVLPLERRGGMLGVRASGGGGGFSQQVTIDARGADKAAIVRLERAIHDLARAVPGMAVQAVADARMR